MARRAASLARRWAAVLAVASLLVQAVAAGPAAAMWAAALPSGHCATALDNHPQGKPGGAHLDGLSCCVLCTAATVHGPLPATPGAGVRLPVASAGTFTLPTCPVPAIRSRHVIASPRAPPGPARA